MFRRTIITCIVVALLGIGAISWITVQSRAPSSGTSSAPLRGTSSYTPYDAFAMLWARQSIANEIVWASSGGAAGRLLTAGGSGSQRPDWALCTQGVVAGLAARGEDVRIIASVYVADDAILPVFRQDLSELHGARSLFIPRSSIEFAFDRLLSRHGVSVDAVRLPAVESVGFPTIVSLLKKPASDDDALDFAILVDPFITNLLSTHPGEYRLGEPGLYKMHYSLVVRADDLASRRESFERLLANFLRIDQEIRGIRSDEAFQNEVWGRSKDGAPEKLPELVTFKRDPLRLQLQVTALREQLREEIEYLVSKYPDELRMPKDIDSLVDPSLLRALAASRVTE